MEISADITNFWDYGEYAGDAVKEASIYSSPLASTYQSIIRGLRNFTPSFLYRITKKVEDHMMISTDDDINKAADFYLNKGVKISKEIGDLAAQDLRDRITNVMKERLQATKQSLDAWNRQYHTSAQLCIELKNQLKAPYAVGGSRSLSDPLIVFPYLRFVIQTKEQLVSFYQGLEESHNTEMEKFVLAHEFMHIVHNDGLISTIRYIANAILSSTPWIVLLSSPGTWLDIFLYGTAASFSLGFIGSIVNGIFSRRQEKRADIEAMNLLKTNQGAIAHFEKIKKAQETLQMYCSQFSNPSISDRLIYAKEWKNPQKI